MKSAYLLFLTLVTVVFIGFLIPQARADDAKGISIQNISVQPYSVKVGDTFTVTATLVNNSTFPISVSDMISKDCQGPFFTVSFDDHVKVGVTAKDGLTCSYVGLQERLDPGKKYTGTSPGLSFAYTAIQSGTANVTVTFPYEIKNQTDPNQSNMEQAISKSFLFTIYDSKTNSTIPTYGGGGPVVTITLDPLEQFKSGIPAKSITCQKDFVLIIKSEDGSPACVKLDTEKKLYERGWTSVLIVTTENNMTSNRPVEISSIKPSSALANPGGPSIQVALKNVGLSSITSLKATLHLNNDYVFDFKDITTSQPFLSGNSAYDTKILIGAGFSSELAYPITIDGVVNNVSFSYTQNVRIPYTNENFVNEDFSKNTIVPDSFVVCDTPYEYKQGFIPVLYMPANSDGRICVNYWNPNHPKNASLTIFDAKSYHIEKSITSWAEPDLIPVGNSTVTYTIKTGNQTGFYGVTVFCVGMPFAIGYDNNSNMSINDFSWEKQQTTSCPLMDFQFKVLSTKNIGIKYIPDH